VKARELAKQLARLGLVELVCKTYVRPHTRRTKSGKVVQVSGYQDKRPAAEAEQPHISVEVQPGGPGMYVSYEDYLSEIPRLPPSLARFLDEKFTYWRDDWDHVGSSYVPEDVEHRQRRGEWLFEGIRRFQRTGLRPSTKCWIMRQQLALSDTPKLFRTDRYLYSIRIGAFVPSSHDHRLELERMTHEEARRQWVRDYWSSVQEMNYRTPPHEPKEKERYEQGYRAGQACIKTEGLRAARRHLLDPYDELAAARHMFRRGWETAVIEAAHKHKEEVRYETAK